MKNLSYSNKIWRYRTYLETQVMDILKEDGKLMTTPEVAYRLQMPLETIKENIDKLKNEGTVREMTLEYMLREGK